MLLASSTLFLCVKTDVIATSIRDAKTSTVLKNITISIRVK